MCKIPELSVNKHPSNRNTFTEKLSLLRKSSGYGVWLKRKMAFDHNVCRLAAGILEKRSLTPCWLINDWLMINTSVALEKHLANKCPLMFPYRVRHALLTQTHTTKITNLSSQQCRFNQVWLSVCNEEACPHGGARERSPWGLRGSTYTRIHLTVVCDVDGHHVDRLPRGLVQLVHLQHKQTKTSLLGEESTTLEPWTRRTAL